MKTDAFDIDASKRDVWELIQTLVAGQVPANAILELFYWSQEPGALEMMRNFVSLSKTNRETLISYFASVDCRSVSIKPAGSGKITLSSTKRSDPTRLRANNEAHVA